MKKTTMVVVDLNERRVWWICEFFWQWWWIYGFLWVTGGGKFSCSGYRVAILVVSGSGGSYCKSVKEKREEREREREREMKRKRD